jgi:hypothetical protein
MAALLRTLAGSGKNAQGHGRARSLSFDATKLRRSSGGVNLAVMEIRKLPGTVRAPSPERSWREPEAGQDLPVTAS